MQRTYQYRLYPSRQLADQLQTLFCQGRLLYNEALSHRRHIYKHTGQTIRFFDQWPRFREERKTRLEDFGLLNATSVQQLLRRLDKSFAAFFRRINNGEKPGFPRFKGTGRFRSLDYRYGDGCRLKGDRFYLQHVGDIRIKQHRPCPQGCLKHIVITRKAGGRWYVSFQGDDGMEPPPRKDGKAVGIDVGLHRALSLSDGTLVEASRKLKASLAKLRRANRALAHKQRFSGRWHRQRQQLARRHERIANQRKDFWHKTTDWLTKHYALIAVEELNLRFMLSNRHLSRSAYDMGLGLFNAMLAYKAERAGCAVVAVDPKYTSQQCSGCGKIEGKQLSQRWHSCSCGVELDRDVNAAVNILAKARSGPTEPNVEAVSSCVLRESRLL